MGINKYFFTISMIFCLFFIACSKHDEDSEKFIRKIETTFSENVQKIMLSDLTDFEWDEVCFFQYDDSPKYLTYKQYLSFWDEKKFTESALRLKKEPYTNIFLFLYKNHPVEVYGLIAPQIKLYEKRYYISVKDLYPNTDNNEICNKASEMIIKPVVPKQHEASGSIYILNKKDSNDDYNN